MSNPCIITVVITGALPTKQDTPAFPVTPSEQIESTHEAYEAGASLVHLQFVLGIPNALPARRSLLEFLIAEASGILPGATWGAAGIGRYQFEVNRWCLELGGHCRTGLEDNIKIAPDRLAASNAELVRKIVGIANEYNRHPASPVEARKILGIGMAA